MAILSLWSGDQFGSVILQILSVRRLHIEKIYINWIRATFFQYSLSLAETKISVLFIVYGYPFTRT